MKNATSIVLLLVALTLGFARDAHACSCVELGRTCGVAGEFWRADAVFHGRVESVERMENKGVPQFLLRRRVRLRVVEGFRGSVTGSEIVVTTGAGGGDCGYPFRGGQEYFVYAYRQGGSGGLTVTSCSGTRKIDDAGAELEYGRLALSGRAPSGRIVGDVRLRAPDSRGRDTLKPMAGVRILLEKDGSVMTAVSDEHGVYSFEAPAAGRYRVSTEIPGEFAAAHVDETIDVPDLRTCVQSDIYVVHDGRVSGRVIDARGGGVGGLTLELVLARAVERAAAAAPRVETVTDDDGSYEFQRVPPGRFVVGINTSSRSEAGAQGPLPRAFHPGVSDIRAAKSVTVGAGERVTLGDLALPDSIHFVRVTGIVVGSDGMSMPGSRVYLKDDEAGYILGRAVTADSSGRFVLAALAGRRYRVFAEHITTGGGTRTVLSTPETEFAAEDGLTPFRLVLRRHF